MLNLKIYLFEPNLVLGRGNRYFLNICKKIFCYTNQIKNFPSPDDLWNRIYKDKNEEISTIKIYKTGEIVGLEQILCGIKGTSLRASSKIEANYLLKEILIFPYRRYLLIEKPYQNDRRFFQLDL